MGLVFTDIMAEEQKRQYDHLIEAMGLTDCQFDINAIRKNPTIVGLTKEESEKMTSEELNYRVKEAYAKAGLTSIERGVVDLRYGFGDSYTYTLEEVGKIFKVTRERVRQLEAKSIRKLKASLEESL